MKSQDVEQLKLPSIHKVDVRELDDYDKLVKAVLGNGRSEKLSKELLR